MYDLVIKNCNQPMIITKAKKTNINKTIEQKVCNKTYYIYKNCYTENCMTFMIFYLQDSDICCLVPELCNLTGLTEAMKSDFKLMKALQIHTLVTPSVRQQSIIDFVNRINGMNIVINYFNLISN